MAAPVNQFLPKQAYHPNATLYQEVVGDSTINIAQGFLNLIGPLPEGAIVHDNGCGSGQVIGAIMATNPPQDICIIATDIDKTQLVECMDAAIRSNWPAIVAEVPAEALSYPNHTFTHSFSNILLMATRNGGKDAAKEIFRTLKPGGTAVATWFRHIPHQEVLKEVHRELRGPDIALPHGMPEEWYDANYLRRVMEYGGFETERLHIKEIGTQCTIPDLKHWVTILWSYLGAPATGWTLHDEENWNYAIDSMVERLQDSPAWEGSKDGLGGTLKMSVNVCIALK